MRKENKQTDIADNQICIDDYLYSGRKGHIDLENSESDSESDKKEGTDAKRRKEIRDENNNEKMELRNTSV